MTFLTSMTKRAAVIGGVLLATLAGPAAAFEPGDVECIAPANPGGGWDFTCRQVGKALYDLKLVPNPVRVTNMAGGSGGVAYAHVTSDRNEDNNLLVAASSATSTRLAQKAFPNMTMDMVRWVASIGADYGVIAVSKDSPINTLPELFEQIKADPSSVSIGGGSAVGGWDHLKVLIAAQAAGIESIRTIKYIAFEGGGEAVTALLGNHLQAFSGDISEAKGFVDSGDIKILGVLAPDRLPNEFAEFPTAKEQGIDAVGANWRGFYAPGGMTDEAYEFWVSSIKTLYDSPEWKEVMKTNGLMPLDLQGDAFQSFVETQVKKTEELSKEIGLIK